MNVEAASGAERRVRGAAVVAAALAGALVLAGGPPGRAQPPPSPSPAPLSGGPYLYLRDCAWCHGERGEGTNNGPSLVGVGAASADFMLSTGRMPIERPDQRPVRGPAFYSRAQIDQLAAYVASFGPGPGVPVVAPATGDLALGAELYEINCAACHSSTGAGGALTNGLIAPDILHSTPTEIAEAVRIGGAGLRSGHMPRFGPDVLSDHELDSIIRYIQDLQRRGDRGGVGLGRIGPVAEGFAGWFVGLLLLLLYVRYIGIRSRG